MAIDKTQLTQIREALLSAFPKRQNLEMMVFDQLKENLSAIAGDSNLEHTVFELVRWAEARGRLEELVIGALIQNPGNDQLRSAAEKLVESQNLSKIELYQSKCALLLQSKRFDEALETCQVAISQGLDKAQFMRYKGQIQYERHHYQEACESYKVALQIKPENAYLYKEQGDIFFKIGQLNNAHKAYGKARDAYASALMQDVPFRDEINRMYEKTNRKLKGSLI